MGKVDPTLPRDGTDFIRTASRDGHADPTLPRDGTDFMIGQVDPTLLTPCAP
jgi:hypothetical protein